MTRPAGSRISAYRRTFLFGVILIPNRACRNTETTIVIMMVVMMMVVMVMGWTRRWLITIPLSTLQTSVEILDKATVMRYF